MNRISALGQAASLASRRAAVRPSFSNVQQAIRQASSQTTAITQRGNHIPEHHVVPSEDDMVNDPQLAGLGYPQMAPTSRQLRPAKGWWDNQERWV